MVNEERKLDRDVERLEEQGDRVERHIGDARGDWESKEQDTSVPGAQPDPDDEEDEAATGNPAAAGAEDPDE